MAVYYGLYFGWLGIDVSRNPKLCSGKKEKNVKYAHRTNERRIPQKNGIQTNKCLYQF